MARILDSTPPQTSYIICGTARSGSTLLCEVLANSGLGGRPAEYFGRSRVEWNAKQWGVSASMYVDRVIQECTTPNGVFGTKVHWSALPDLLARTALHVHAWPTGRGVRGRRLYATLLAQRIASHPGLAASYRPRDVPTILNTAFPNIHYVRVVRNDRLRQAISHAIATQTRVWSVRGQNAPKPSQQPAFNFNLIEQKLNEHIHDDQCWDQFCRDCHIEPLTIAYEDMAPDPELTARSVLTYLGVPLPDALTFSPLKLHKQANSLTEEWIQRYHDVKASQGPS
jgi:LPS sulfotransferase NodH